MYHKFVESNIDIIKLYIRHSEERLVEWSKAHYFDVLIHQYTSCEFESRLRFFFYFYYQYSHSFLPFSRNEKGEHHFIVHFDTFSVITHAQWIFIQKMAEQSAESYVSLFGNDKAISILQNVKKVMVVLKKHTYEGVSKSSCTNA